MRVRIKLVVAVLEICSRYHLTLELAGITEFRYPELLNSRR